MSLVLVLLLGKEGGARIKFPRSWLYVFLAINFFVLALSVRHDVYVNYYIKFFALSLYALLFCSIIKCRVISVADLIVSCNALVATHVTFFLVQLIVYQVFGFYINFDNYVRESASEALYLSRALEGMYISIRATGLFSEPSFYAMVVLPVSLFLILHQKKLTIITALGIVSVMAGLSIAALAVSFLALIIILAVVKGGRLYLIGILSLTLLASSFIFEVYKRRVVDSVDYDAVYSRQLVFKEFKVRGAVDNFLGSGFFWDERHPLGRNMLSGAHVRDSSFYVYAFFTSGAFGLVALLLGLLAFIYRNPKYGAALSIILLFKYHVLSGALWLVLILLFAFVYVEGKESKVSLS
ncbi:hypothetical protein LPB260_14195 [Pseudomonas sp. LPB0260]|uniref:hypothetical protein n=1 Tax=Pseudomonas sp. LPB0260 TaxID=2614442 RepID=UPI0015C20D1E|nr:hypothetical protein [Pseudomonas sp. LPB0260]QLC74728.1 hypothetical protein LPB260_14195 [Pseudomonas sp. LPB0260]